MTPILLSLPEFPIIHASGSDAVRYLHGRLTQDIRAIPNNGVASSLVLNPQGKVLGKMMVLRRDNAFLLIADPMQSDDERTRFQEAVLQFRVSDDISLDEVNSQVLWLLGSETTALHDHFKHHGWVSVRQDLGAVAGELFLVSPEEFRSAKPKIEHLGATLGELATFQQLRVEQKVPLFPDDLGAKVLAPDIDLVPYVSFNKGCYTGQEVVEMATARGRPSKRFVAFQSENVIPIGSEVISKESGTSCGFITSAISRSVEEDSLSLGFVRYDVADGTPLSANGIDLTWR